MDEEFKSADAKGREAKDLGVPVDYPRDPYPAALAGAQPKVTARLIDGRYVVGLTVEERKERYEFCVAWLEQLVGYVSKVKSKKPHLSSDEVLQYVHAGVRSQREDLGEVELDWMMSKLRERVMQQGDISNSPSSLYPES